MIGSRGAGLVAIAAVACCLGGCSGSPPGTTGSSSKKPIPEPYLHQLRAAVTLPSVFKVGPALYFANPVGPSIVSETAYLASDTSPRADAILFGHHPLVLVAHSDCYWAPSATTEPAVGIAVDVLVFNGNRDAVAVSEGFRSDFARGTEGLPKGAPSDIAQSGVMNGWTVIAMNQDHVDSVMTGVIGSFVVEVEADHPPVASSMAASLPDTSAGMQWVWKRVMARLPSAPKGTGYLPIGAD